jgi:hypothetical protein
VSAGGRQLIQAVLGCLLIVGVIQSVVASSRRTPASDAARFDLLFLAVLFLVSFVAVTVQKPVYIYSRFFLYLPISVSWVAARGWSMMSLRQARPAPAQSRVELLRRV